MKHYDIIVVGAGPGGSNFARLVDSKKYSILLVDGSDGHDKVCGGLLSPDAQDILARYDICLPKDLLVSPQLFSVRTIDLGNSAVKRGILLPSRKDEGAERENIAGSVPGVERQKHIGAAKE